VTVIELPDDQAAALTARAAAQGLTLEAWFGSFRGPTCLSASHAPQKSRYSLTELMAQCDTNAPLSAEDRAWMDAPAIGREA
jgi:hypothetical protein